MDDAKESRETRRNELFFPRTLGIATRAVLWLRGYFDARMGKVQLAEGGYVSSPYCKLLVDRADLRINAEWQECNGAMFEIKPDLENAIRERDELFRQISALPREKALAMDEAEIVHEGDMKVSTHLSERRHNRRLALVEQRFETQEAHLQALRNEADARVSSLLSEYQDCRDIASTHERVVRIDYLARLSAYTRGASCRLRISSKFINDLALTTEPREENNRFFLGCISGELKDHQPQSAKD